MGNEKSTYYDRFDVEYLEFLANELELRNLIKTAMSASESNRDNVLRYPEFDVIEINFAGFGANTILNSNPKRCGDKYKNESDAAYAERMDEIDKWRKKIADNFALLLNPKTLEKLNNLGYKELGQKNPIRVKIRFQYQYLYGDFPACLRKAEKQTQAKVLAEQTDFPTFYVNPPLSREDHSNDIPSNVPKNQGLFGSQMSSLNAITDLIKNNPHLAVGSREPLPNRIQVRFSVIPSPLCSLTINRLSIVDNYFYAPEIQDSCNLSVHFPLHIINGRFGYGKDERMIDYDKRMLHFQTIENHFGYLWNHDLNLYCMDGSFFYSTKDKPFDNIPRINNAFEFGRIKTPTEVIRDSQWLQKIRRLVEKDIDIKKERALYHYSPDEEVRRTEKDKLIEAINNWKLNLNLKFILNTRKLDETQVGDPLLFDLKSIIKEQEPDLRIWLDKFLSEYDEVKKARDTAAGVKEFDATKSKIKIRVTNKVDKRGIETKKLIVEVRFLLKNSDGSDYAEFVYQKDNLVVGCQILAHHAFCRMQGIDPIFIEQAKDRRHCRSGFISNFNNECILYAYFFDKQDRPIVGAIEVEDMESLIDFARIRRQAQFESNGVHPGELFPGWN